MLKVYSFWQINLVCLWLGETNNSWFRLKLFNIFSKHICEVVRIHVSMKNHGTIGKCYCFIIMIQHIIERKMCQIQSLTKPMLINSQQLFSNYRVNCLVELKLRIEKFRRQFSSKPQSLVLKSKPPNHLMKILSTQ